MTDKNTSPSQPCDAPRWIKAIHRNWGFLPIRWQRRYLEIEMYAWFFLTLASFHYGIEWSRIHDIKEWVLTLLDWGHNLATVAAAAGFFYTVVREAWIATLSHASEGEK